MIRIVSIIFLLLPVSVWGQKYSFDSTSFFKETRQINFREPSIKSFKRNFENDSLKTTDEDIKSFKTYMIFKKSSTIFDVTKIILSSNGKFISYYRGCLAEGVTAGNYQIKDNTLIITSSKNVYTNLKYQKVFRSLDYPFFEIGTINYQITKEGLVYLR